MSVRTTLELLLPAAVLMATPGALACQERGSAAVTQQVSGIGNTMRVLIIAAHPDDEDTQLIAWLTHGQHVETAYLSLTRGDGGQNLIGNELGEALGVIRTAELMSARRIDGAQQYFTRAFDFGFSKDTIDTFKHWPRDSLLRDVVRVVRDFKPHVIVAIFSGTPRDGHGQHQVSAILAREVWTAAADTVRFPARDFGAAWTPLKFYRNARFSPGEATLRMNVGEYSPVLGKSYFEIAAESRSQHKSQGFGTVQRKGVVWDWLRRDEIRVAAPPDPKTEQSMFDGIDTSLNRLKNGGSACAKRNALLDSLQISLTKLKALAPADRKAVIAGLSVVQRYANNWNDDAVLSSGSACGSPSGDAMKSMQVIDTRVNQALVSAADVTMDAVVNRRTAALGDTFTVTTTIYNRGSLPIVARGGSTGNGDRVAIQPDSSLETKLVWNNATIDGKSIAAPGTMPTWLRVPRNGDLFGTPSVPMDALRPGLETLEAKTSVTVDSAVLSLSAPLTYRFADPVRGDVQLPFALTPGITVSFERPVELARSGVSQRRAFNVTLRSSFASARNVNLTLQPPVGMSVSDPTRSVTLGAGASRTITFLATGKLPAGIHTVHAVAESDGTRYSTGYVPIEYEHIPPERLYHAAEVKISSVPVDVPTGLRIAYVPGVGDNVPAALEEVGISVTTIEPKALSATPLSGFTTIVVGPRAYQASHDLIDNASYLLDYARSGGTLVVQYGQYEMTQTGVMPYPITLSRPADRVTDELAAITITDKGSSLLSFPNRITNEDFSAWIQERSLYMPTTFDANYKTLMSLNDYGETPKTSAILVTPYGKGLYIYTTLSFFRQLPAGNPGATKLFVNLLSAKRTQ